MDEITLMFRKTNQADPNKGMYTHQAPISVDLFLYCVTPAECHPAANTYQVHEAFAEEPATEVRCSLRDWFRYTTQYRQDHSTKKSLFIFPKVTPKGRLSVSNSARNWSLSQP